jgi:predicted phosphohydrolase
LKIFAIGDLHLSFNNTVDPLAWDSVEVYKPMDVFGEEWREHYRKIYDNWMKTVKNGDLVLMPGDVSWALKLYQARFDLAFLGLLPGNVICVAGNHDYWWQSLAQVRSVLPGNMEVIQNDHVLVGDIAICGSRGWWCPGSQYFTSDDLKIYRRELIRMENSLKSVDPAKVKDIIVIIHFMPTAEGHEKNEFIEMFQKYRVSTVIYSHLHGAATRLRLPESAWGIKFHLVSADFLKFSPLLIKDLKTNRQD